MLKKVARVSLALEVGLVCIEGVFPQLPFLPLGGSPLSQIGFCLGSAWLISEVAEVLSRQPKRAA